MSSQLPLKTRTSENFLRHSERFMSWQSSPFRDSHVFFKSLSLKSFEYKTLYLRYWKCLTFNFDSHSLIHLSRFGKRWNVNHLFVNSILPKIYIGTQQWLGIMKYYSHLNENNHDRGHTTRLDPPYQVTIVSWRLYHVNCAPRRDSVFFLCLSMNK